MLLVENNNHDPAWNLALDEYLLTQFTEEVLSLWRNGPAVIIGRNQNALEEIDLEFIRERGVPVVRRMTGGGAVFHDLGNVNFTLAQPCEAGDFSNYEKFTRPIIRFLDTLGVRAELSGRNDLLLEGMKFSGNAQTVRGGRILHHGTLLFSTDMADLSGALRPRSLKLESRGVKSVASRVTNISSHLNSPMEVEDFLSGLRSFFLRDVPGLQVYPLTERDRQAVDRLKGEKYGTWEWTFGAAPPYTWSRAVKYPFGLVDVRLDIRKGRIGQVSIFGDFFGQREVPELERALEGLPHRREELLVRARELPLEEYISGMTPEEFVELLCG